MKRSTLVTSMVARRPYEELMAQEDGPTSAFERLSVPGFNELPNCRCGRELHIVSIDPLPERSDTHIRIYNCPACHHEIRLTVWGTDCPSAQASP
jgi:hypothetical protein